MTVELPISESLREILLKGLPDISKAAMEGVALEGYRQGVLSLADVRELLALESRWEAQAFLSSVGAWPDYDSGTLKEELTPLAE